MGPLWAPNPKGSPAFRRHPDLNWGIEDLQSTALPLGYAAFIIFIIIYSKFFLEKLVCFQPFDSPFCPKGQNVTIYAQPPPSFAPLGSVARRVSSSLSREARRPLGKTKWDAIYPQRAESPLGTESPLGIYSGSPSGKTKRERRATDWGPKGALASPIRRKISCPQRGPKGGGLLL